MEKCLLILIFIAVLTSSLSANTRSYCEEHKIDKYKICGYADTITFINQTWESPKPLKLNVATFSAIAPYAFRKMEFVELNFYSLSLNKCNPKVIDLTPKSFEGLSVSVLNLECVKFEVKPNPFKNLKSISNLKLERVQLMGNISQFFADFPLLDKLELFHLNITISPDIFSGINKNLKYLYIKVGINVVERKSFERFHNVDTLQLAEGHMVELHSDLFDGLNQLRRLDLEGNGITRLRRHTFDKLPQLKRLYLTHNEIRKIEFETFSFLLNLQLIELMDNNLKNLPVGVFHNLRNLLTLDLSWNKIRTVPFNVFTGCAKLRYLYLNGNGIYYIEPTAFWGLNLNRLNLRDTHLTVLQHDTFAGLRVVYSLNLGSNNIGRIDPQAFRSLTAETVSLCFRNTTQIDTGSWGVSLIKDIVINDC